MTHKKVTRVISPRNRSDGYFVHINIVINTQMNDYMILLFVST